MKETCAWCGRKLAKSNREGGLVRTDEGVLCETCAPVYFKTLSEPYLRPSRKTSSPPRSAPESPPNDATTSDETPHSTPAAETPPSPQKAPAATHRPADESEKASKGEDRKAAPGLGREEGAAALEEIRRQVDQIRRSLLFEKSSAWNALAAIAQCFALAALAFAAVHWPEGPQNFLLLALLLQAMALTFFVNGK